MTPFDRHLQAAAGWLELGLPLEAHEELEEIEPELRTLSPVLAVRVHIYQKLGKWEHMEVVCRQLCAQQPDEPQWFLSLGYATRRAFGLQEALAVLAQVANRFPACAAIHLQLGLLRGPARASGRCPPTACRGIKLDPVCRAMAQGDPDLAALHGELTADDQEGCP